MSTIDQTKHERGYLTLSQIDSGARQTVSRRQIVVGLAIVAILGFFAIVAPLATAIGLIAAVTLLYLAALIYRLAIYWLSFRNPEVAVVTDEEARSIPADELPIYTVLVPAYHEPSVIGALIGRLREFEYPVDKLDIRILLEEDDGETIAATAAELAAHPGPQFTIVRVPDSQPRTKPKACNYGLLGARGEYVTIYDAEDRPEPLQLRRAVAALERFGSSVACLQAKLSYYNADQNLLTRWFTIEYAMWFSFLLPGLVSRARTASARRNFEPLPTSGLACGGWLGPVQRDRGCRSGHPSRPAGLSDPSPREHHTRGGQQRRHQLDQAAVPLVQGLSADMARPYPASATAPS
jgi:hypothetical protein